MDVIWSALIAGAAALAATVLTAVITFRITNRQVASSERLGALQRQHELDLAREERHQQRKQDAYVAVAAHVVWSVRFMDWRVMKQKVRLDPPVEPPMAPDSENQILSVLVLSKKASDMLVDLNHRFDEFGSAANMYENGGLTGNDAAEALRKQSEAHQVAAKAALELTDQLRAELATDGQLTPVE
jgi:hypothetical protein